MTYDVIVTPAAEEELDEAYLWLLAETVQHAPVWYNGAIAAMESLAENPARCPVISGPDEEEVRQLLYGDKRHAYRILFTIRGTRVYIVHLFHAARYRP